MLKPLTLVSLSTLAAPLAFAAESYGDKPKDEAVGFGALLYGFTDTTTLVAFSALVIFLIIVNMLGGFKFIFSALDKRADDIRQQLEEAKTLRSEASKALAEAERKAQEADAAASEIIARAQADAEAFMKQAKADLEAKVARREAQAEQRIARAEAEAMQDVRKAAADAATRAASEILSNDSKAEDLFGKALSDIEKSLS